MTDIDLLTQFTEYKTEIARILDKTERPGDQVPDSDARAILEVVKKIGQLGARLKATAKATLPTPERPDPLAAGAKLHSLALEQIEASSGKLTYSQAWAKLVFSHWELIREWQQSVQAPRRRR
jgi:hypothetical protein